MCGSPYRRVRSRQACVCQSNERQRRVPDGREAGLHTQCLVLLEDQIVQLLQSPAHLGRIIGITQAAQANDRVNHGRKDRPNAIAIGKVFEQPGFGPLQRRGPDRSEAPGFQPFDHLVQGQEEVRRSQAAARRRVRPKRRLGRFEKELPNA